MTSKTPLRIVLGTAVVSLAMLGLAVAQRPLNIPNYLLSSMPLLQPNITLQGSLTSDDGQNFKDGSYLDIYAFDAIAGDEVVLVVEADFMDTYIVLYSPSGELIDYNDDLTSTSQSGLDVTLFESGRHLVVVTTFFGGETGNYSVTRYTPDQAPMELFANTFLNNGFGGTTEGLPAPMPISVPTRLERGLTDTMPIVVFEGSETFLEHFSFAVEQRRLASISMSSNRFDTYLVLFDQNGDMVASNDDDPNGFNTDSNLTLPLDPGTYSVVATSLFGLEIGSYLLEVELFSSDT